jgi:hypothetical protein
VCLEEVIGSMAQSQPHIRLGYLYRRGRESVSKRCWIEEHDTFFVRIIIAPVLNGTSGRSLTRGRSGAGVLGHLILVIQIFRIRGSAVWGDLDLGVLTVL